MQPSVEVCAVAWPWRQKSKPDLAAAARAARVSGLIQAAVGFAAAGLFYFWLHRQTMATVVASLAFLNGAIALISPLGLYQKVTAAVAVLGRVIGQVVTWLLMPLVFFLLFLPVGLLLRRFGNLRLTRTPDRSLTTYWRDLPQADRTRESYSKQF